MRSFLTSLALASTILSVHALNLVEKRDGSAPKVVQHSIRRRHDVDALQNHQSRVQRRAGTVTASLTNEQTLYLIDVDVGTPGQQQELHIDTGSSDLWVNVPGSQLCSSSGSPCSSGGTFDSSSSSTYKVVNNDFNITYVDGSGAQGDYSEDTVSFAGIKLEKQEFGVGLESTSKQGVLGIGFPINEAITQNGLSPYVNVPQHLVESGYISSNVYSLWLDDLDAKSGSIVFGGVDTDKYTGKLETLPIIPEDGAYRAFIIALTGIEINGQTVAKDQSIGALLDSGSSLIYLPNDIAKAIYKSLNAQFDASEDLAIVDCSLANSDNTIDFTFSSPTIKVPLSQIILNAGSQCYLGVGESGGPSAILGDAFIRGAYIVYDLDNNEISLAQTDFTSTSSNIVEIGSNGDVPDATVVQNAQTSAVGVNGGGVNIGFSSVAGTPNAALPTAAVGYNMALLGAAGAAILAL